MYRIRRMPRTTISVNQQYTGELIENKISRILNTKEPITDVVERIYTNRKDGVLPEYDIRTDRWDVALQAFDTITASHLAQREERHKPIGEEAKEGMDKEKGSESPSVQGTSPDKQ